MIGRLAPVPVSMRCGESNGARMLDALKHRRDFLLGCTDVKQCSFLFRFYGPMSLDQLIWRVSQHLREQGNYLIQSGVR